MSSVTVGPRLQFDLDRYIRLRVRDPTTGRDRYVNLHRLVAYAHGELEHIRDDLDVHHLNGDRWDNRPSNLEAREPAEHGRYHANTSAD